MKQLILAISIALLVLLGCNQREESETTNIDFSGYVAGHSVGTISANEAIRFSFASKVVPPDEVGSKANSNIMSIKPSVKGSFVWIDEQTIEFRPEGNYKRDTEYSVEVNVDKVFDNVPKKQRNYRFNLRTMKQAMELKVNGLEFYTDPTRTDRRISGTVLTADFVDKDEIKKTVNATQHNRELEITWASSADGRTHTFWVEGVEQTGDTEKVLINSTGVPIQVHDIGFEAVEIPPKGVFRVLSHNVVQSPEQYIEVRFSEPIDPSQNLYGLIKANGIRETRIIADGNLVRVYPTTRVSGSYTFEVSPGIRSIQGDRLDQQSNINVQFQRIKPQIKLAGKGVIIPSSGGLLFPFQAVNLRAVDVTVFRIFEDNIAQFLQASNLDGASEISRVGRMLLKKTIMLDQTGQTDFARWNTYNIDLAELVKTEPGAIYRVTLSMRLEYSTYTCNGEENDQPITLIDERYNSSDDIPRTYYYYDDIDYELYDWRERDNPCHTSYYQRKSVHRNVLASNVGMVAKAGTNGSWLFAISDINTALPISGVEVELLNFQQQTIATSTTNSNGMVTFELTEQQIPFLAIAKNGSQRGYLKLDQGSSLSLSAFDVSGQSVQKGLKGFIYGERGVWRPGDTLFVSFILEDKGKTLPPSHPVTFELTNSRGQLVYRSVATSSAGGMYSFPVATNPDDPTGTYNARVQVGGVSFNKGFKVESIMPNRLKINFNFDEPALHYGEVSPVTFTSAWLHGAPARNLRVKIDATLSQGTTKFSGYEGYTFDDPARSFYAEEQTVFEGQLDQDGKVTFSPNINVNSSAPGRLNAHFTARVFEDGGAFSIDRFSIPYYPYRSFVGVKMPNSNNYRNTYLTDTTHNVSVVVVTPDGKPLSQRAVTVEVYKIDWRWWWERSNENLSQYTSNSYKRPIQKAVLTTNSQGQASYNLRINNPEWGRFLIRVVDTEGGHATGTIAYFDWPGWVSRNRKSTPETSSMLVFATDKDSYNVGEEATVTIPSPKGGRILVSIENGIKVLKSEWINASAGETQYKFTTTASMTPNVFISALLIQPHNQTANDLPLRMYGIAPIGVENPETHITPTIKMPDVIEPEQKVSITIAEKDGKPMAFTLAMVDDGLLDLTRYRTPSPWQHFYAREALGVRTWDLYDLVLGASAGQMQRIISIGGDGESTSEGDKTANRFKPVVRYFGPYQLEKGKKKKIDFTMPNYVGSVRVMAIAASNGAYGEAEKTVAVRKPLMVLATLPRVLGPDEEVVLPVTVFAMEPKIKNVSIEVETNELLSVDGNSRQTIDFNDVGDKVVRFKMKTVPKLGVAKVKVVVKSGRESASHEIELNVRNPNPPMTQVRDTVLKSTEKWDVQYQPFGMVGTNIAAVELSTLPPINLDQRLRYLLGYPHGCLEQTVSKAFPQLLISKLADVDDEVKQRAQENVRYALDRLRSFRTTDGGLSLWPGSAYPDEWATAYAGHFMLEAQRLGYSIASDILDGIKRSTRRAAQNWSAINKNGYRNNDLMQAYRLYVLALANAPEMGAMNRLRESANLSVSAKWRLAAAYTLAGNPEAAQQLINNVPTAIKSYREQYYTYGSDLRDRAMIVETLILLKDFDRAMPLLQQLSTRLSSSRWMSTQELSFSLLAFSKFAQASNASQGVDATIAINGAKAQQHTTNLSILQKQFNPSQTSKNRVVVQNNGKGLLYARLISHGIPVSGKEEEQSNNLKVDISYYLMNGNSINPESLTQGTDFYADITVYNPGSMGNLEQLILSYVVPSGWEIRTSRLDEGQTSHQSSPFDYQDIRDDRVYTYFNLGQGQTKNFKILLNAAYQGKFYMPGISCEAMYDNSVNARKQGNWVEVVLP